VTAERYTAVFTGFLSVKEPGEYLYLSMSEDSLAPGGSTLRRGRPPYGRMGREIPFKDLPEDCRRLVLDTYKDLWGLQERSA
jgi:hypothetical protein